ncbi:uncharacterized protein B0H18DRAFT_292915 [Fomitopsis serialis]|uniref:uncharacterized protein n=1 Tax=Fomitopsis serialis TaxID=139415 RepID=UPI002007E771|nr:uncharacterized protein B0H18DRAFT_292915 [Neoantrodia serialis]KAH9927291.1 hypothetical protein B0H18DRAFT_292915 [Neoantrodia serialis]
MELRNIKVEILTDGDEDGVPEYSVDEQDERLISCYIASEAGKSFSVDVYNGLSDEIVSADCYMDGENGDRLLVDPGSWSEIKGVTVARGMQRSYIFANVQVTDDENVVHDIQDLGSIKICIYRVVRRGVAQEPSAYGWDGANEPIHELSKKAGLHRISLADVVPDDSTFSTCDYIDEKQNPYATFRFMYRPLEILKAQGIIPSTPTPEPDAIVARASSSAQHSLPNNDNGTESTSDEQPHLLQQSQPIAGPSSPAKRADKRRAPAEAGPGESSQANKRQRPANPREEDVKPNLDDIKPHIASHDRERDNANVASAEQIVGYLRAQLDNAKRDLAEKEQIVRYVTTQLEAAERDLATKKAGRAREGTVKREQADRSIATSSAVTIDLTDD